MCKYVRQLTNLHTPDATNKGLTLIDVLVGVAIAVTLLAAVFGMFQISLDVLYDAGARAQATALAEQRMEYIRSLPYRQVGTEGGIPDGVLKEEETITRNEITYTRRTFVQYYDDSEDGTGDDDENDVVQDYKRAKVAVSWTQEGKTKTVESASYVVPNGVESSTGGGTLSIKVFDAVGDPVADAKVEVDNPSTSPAVDTETFTNASGTTRFSGAQASSNYQITVSKPGYSTARTYDETDTNVDPDPGHLTVSSSSVTTASFPIDILSDLTVNTRTPIRSASHTEPFTDESGIASSSQVEVMTGELILDTVGSGYATSGTAYTVTFGTSTVRRWKQLEFTATTSSDTEARFHLAEKTNTGYSRLTNTELSGNESGFTSSPVSLSDVSTSTYDKLAVEVGLETTATDTTPKVDSLAVTFEADRMPKPFVDLRLHGEKTIGERSDGSPIYKHTFATSTDSSGQRQLANMEWDTYHFRPNSTSSQRVAAACPQEPYPLSPATTSELTLAVADTTDQSAYSLRVDVNANGSPVGGATTTLERSGYTATDRTYNCGQSLFADLGSHDDYRLTITSDDYPKKQINNISVDGAELITVDLTN